MEEFGSHIIGPTILKKLLARPECVRKLNREELTAEEQVLYEEGKPADFFTLVVEGSLDVRSKLARGQLGVPVCVCVSVSVFVFVDCTPPCALFIATF